MDFPYGKRLCHPHLPRLEKTLASLRSEVLMRPTGGITGMGEVTGYGYLEAGVWCFFKIQVNKEKHVPHHSGGKSIYDIGIYIYCILYIYIFI